MRKAVTPAAENANEQQVQSEMRTLLRNTATGLYFQGPDRWTRDPAQALDFKMIDRALEFIENFSLRDMELAFAFGGAQKITTVPLEKISLRYAER